METRTNTGADRGRPTSLIRPIGPRLSDCSPGMSPVRRGRSSHWQGDRTQSTVWSVPNLNPLGGDRTGENAVTGHGTQKPVRLFERAILNHTVAEEAIYDPFLGSGTALIAAEKTGRTCFALELDPCTSRPASTAGRRHGWTCRAPGLRPTKGAQVKPRTRKTPSRGVRAAGNHLPAFARASAAPCHLLLT